MLPSTSSGELSPQLLGTIDDNATAVLHVCHRALQFDGRAHGYTAEEWLPAVYDIADSLLEEPRLHREPPSFVEHAQDTVRWLSHAIVNLDEDAPEAAAIADALGRLLALFVFAGAAQSRRRTGTLAD